MLEHVGTGGGAASAASSLALASWSADATLGKPVRRMTHQRQWLEVHLGDP